MNFTEFATRRIEQLNALTSTLEAAAGTTDSRTVMLTNDQLGTLLNLVGGEHYSIRRRLQEHLEMVEIVRRLHAGESLSEAE